MGVRPIIIVVGCVLVAAGCAASSAARPDPAPATTTSTSPTSTSTATPSTTTPSTSTTTATTSTTTTATTSSTSTTTTSTTVAPPPTPAMVAANLAFDRLAAANQAATMTVVRDGAVVLNRASGTTIDGAPATSDSPMVVASVSKLLTGLMIARLDEASSIDVDAPVPWGDITTGVHPGWNDVTPRELLTHTSGMPVVRPAWFEGGADCAAFLPTLLAQPPTGTRGRWTYSNGNYCALGRLVEQATGLPLDWAVHTLVLHPIDADGAHLGTSGQRPGDVAYAPGVARLSRLGGAGDLVVSTDDVARALADVTATDLQVMTWPGVFFDQYGWGHTGTVDGAKACAWVLDGGRTTVAATIAGGSPATGGGVCDIVVPAIADDLGIGQGPPDRSPP